MKFRIAILDDSQMDRDSIVNIVNQHFSDEPGAVEINAFGRSDLLLLEIREGKEYDIYLLDMELPSQTEIDKKGGLYVAREIRKWHQDAFIIYITNYVHLAIEGYEVSAFRYIPKNQLGKKLPEALNIIIPKIEEINNQSYVIEKNKSMERILCKDIYYVQKEGKYISIHHKHGISWERKALKVFYEEIGDKDFCYIDQGCLVNLRNVEACQRDMIRLKENIVVPVSRKRFDEVKKGLMSTWRGAD